MRRRLPEFAAALLLGVLWLCRAFAITLPASLTGIDEEAFCGTPFVEVELPEGLTTIGRRAFADSSLRHITIPASVTAIDATAFSGVSPDFFATVAPGSYGENWCKTNHISYSYTDEPYEAPSLSAVAAAMAGFRYIGTSYSEMDCQGFVEQCLADVGLNINLSGSNAWYRTMDWTGTPEECIAELGFIPRGAFLFIHAYDGGEPTKYKADGLGNASHIGFYTGVYQGAIHSSFSKGGVLESKFQEKTIPNGGWNCVGLWHVMDYGETVNRWLSLHGK